MPINPHPLWRQNRCEWCKAGVPIAASVAGYHYRAEAVDSISRYHKCTAPSKDEYIAELEAENAELRKDKENAYMRGFADGNSGACAAMSQAEEEQATRHD